MVNIKLFNQQGTLVKSMVKDRLTPPGYITFGVVLDDMISGIYYIVLESGEGLCVEKLIISK